MNRCQRILILTGIALIAWTMIYGVAYALFDEHQTLEGMGMLMASGFIEASKGNMEAAHAALDAYGALTREYRNEIHSHGHWGMLSLILIVLGLKFDTLEYSDRYCYILACLLAVCATLFPLGVLLQIGPAAAIGKVLSVTGASGMFIGLLLTVYGLLIPGRGQA